METSFAKIREVRGVLRGREGGRLGGGRDWSRPGTDTAHHHHHHHEGKHTSQPVRLKDNDDDEWIKI